MLARFGTSHFFHATIMGHQIARTELVYTRHCKSGPLKLVN